jgi:predicted ATPase
MPGAFSRALTLTRTVTGGFVRIKSIHASNIQPIKLLGVSDLSDIVVFAGPNGVGKTRLLAWLLEFFQNPRADQSQWLQVEATCAAERTQWGKTILDTRNGQDVQILRSTLQTNRKRGKYESTVLNFDSDRLITQITPLQYTWDYQDPFLEEVGWNTGFNSLRARFVDTVHSIFRKVRSRREAIALSVEELIRKSSKQEQAETVQVSIADFPDPLVPFQDAFAQLLAPKSLVPPEAKQQQLFFKDGNQQFPINSLSSGEREVVNVVFDFLLRNPNDCIVVFDEPELHLHPELSYKLLQTLRNSGARNQFIFCTHSAEIITASLDNSVVFISPATDTGANQAIVVREEDQTHQALKMLGQSVGIVSLGRRIVLIEGEHGSLDKQTYGSILRGKFPKLVLVPSGGKGLIHAFSNLLGEVLDHAVWGVQFFMVCDRDALPASRNADDLESKAHGRLRVLKRYHLENYFLDEVVISQIFTDIEPTDSWLRSPEEIGEKLRQIAGRYVSWTAALTTSAFFREVAGNVNILPKACDGKSLGELTDLVLASASAERSRISAALEPSTVAGHLKETMQRLEASVAAGSEEWKRLVPGRTVLRVFCSSRYANFDFGRFKIAYLKVASEQPVNPFAEIEDIFAGFSNYVDNK